MNDDKQRKFLESAVMFADRQVKQLMAERVNRTVDEMWGTEVVPDIGSSINVECKDGKKYTIRLEVVPRDYILDLKGFENDPKVLQSLSYLIHCCRTYYKILEQRGKCSNKTLKVDSATTTLYIHSQDPVRIGLRILESEDHEVDQIGISNN
jgi:hypothetical protein